MGPREGGTGMTQEPVPMTLGSPVPMALGSEEERASVK